MKRTNRQRHEFLLTFFKETDPSGSSKEVNGYFLQKQWNGDTRQWQVAIYPATSWKKAESYKESVDLSWIK